MGWLLLCVLLFTLNAAYRALRRDYHALHVFGSPEWNRYQQQLRDHLDALPEGADSRLQQLYERRLREQLNHGTFVDATEKQRATVRKQHDELFRQRAQYALETKLGERESS